MNLFQYKLFTSHSGEYLTWKIECESLTKADWDCLARIYIETNPPLFKEVIGVERGGIPFAAALSRFAGSYGQTLIVDDVLTTGRSIIYEMHRHHDSRGLVAFDRSGKPLPENVNALFRLSV